MKNNKNMSARGGSAFGGKKIILTIILTVLGAMVFVAPAMAVTSVSLSPVTINTTSGKSFNVTISVNPQGVANYTEKIELTYPADILEARAFNFNGSWMPLSQTGYDLIDNVSGKLIKTAGYPGGISSSATFGTVSFYAKKTGSAVIKLGSGSLALDANNQNVLSGTPQISVIISMPISVPVVENPVEQPTTEQPAVEQPSVTQSEPVSQIPLTAALASVITLGTGSIWVGILVGLIILAIIIYIAYLLKKKKNLGQL